MAHAPLLLPFVLFVLLALAVWHDLRARRIPNAVVFPGTLLALALHAFLPAGAGVLSVLGGFALGLGFLLPMYALRLMGAGDVKLLAMVGAFVGAGNILAVAIATLLAGGVLALVAAAWQRSLRRLLNNTYQTMLHAGLNGLANGVAAPAVASGRLPYAVAIATGTMACVLWLRAFGELPL